MKPNKSDFVSGFILFLIALPLSVGISIASGAPPSAGLLAAAIGGIVGAYLGGAQLTINGPAAGLIVILLDAIQRMGGATPIEGFRHLLMATVVAGAIQIVFAALNLATVGLSFPTSAVHGMLSAIGAIIMIKQFPVLLGVAPKTKSITGILMAFPDLIAHINPEIAVIGLIGFCWLVLTPKIPYLKRLPPPLICVISGVLLGEYFHISEVHEVRVFTLSNRIDDHFLLSVPQNIKDSFFLPDFSILGTKTLWVSAIAIALVASIESTLSIYAVDQLDPERRRSNLNRDLFSKGVCNLLSGLVGGLPMIAEIVRSSANINYGAKSPLSNFVHGWLILLFLVLFPQWLHEIPLTALAAILILVGSRLAHINHFIHAWKVSKVHFIAFVTTFLVTIFDDLLVGIALGVAIESIYILVKAKKPLQTFKLDVDAKSENGAASFRIRGPLHIFNWLKLRRELENSLSAKQAVTIDLKQSPFIDDTVRDQLIRYKNSFVAAGLGFNDEGLARNNHESH